LAQNTTTYLSTDDLKVWLNDGIAAQTVSGPLTNNELRSQAVPTSPDITRGGGPTTANVARVALASDDPAAQALLGINTKLPASPATAGNQETANTSLAAIGADLGAPTDAPAASPTATAGIGALIRLGLQNAATALGNWTTLLALLTARIPAPISNRLPVDIGGSIEISNDAGNALPVNGTFWQATQPISALTLPLPGGAATEARQTTGNMSLASIDSKLPALASGRMPVDIGTSIEVSNDSGNPLPISGDVSISGTATPLPVSGTFWQAIQPVSAAALPLPNGAATSAKQAALGTAGTPSADVLTVQGASGGTALSVAPNITRGGGAIDANTARVTLSTDSPGVTALANIDADLGAPTDSPAATPTATAGIGALIRLGLQNAATALTNWDTLIARIPALVGNRVPVNAAFTALTPTVASVASSATSVLLLAANSNRRALWITNDSTSVLRLSFSNPATQANSSVLFQPSQFLILDPLMIGTGAIYGIWASANGTAQVTEWT